MAKYAIGLDYGTKSARCLIVRLDDATELASFVWQFRMGTAGLLTSDNPSLARHHPKDYQQALVQCIKGALKKVKLTDRDFSERDIVGIGLGATASTPIPVDEKCIPLALKSSFSKNLNAMAWLWKDHTAAEEAKLITDLAQRMRPKFLRQVGGVYSGEWFWAKILHCALFDSAVSEETYTWVELQDYIPALLCGVDDAQKIKRGICAAGHKGLFSSAWGGFPDEEFLGLMHPDLARIRQTLPNEAFSIGNLAGYLCEEWAQRIGLRAGLPIAIGSVDAHIGAVGAGVSLSTLVKSLGTSSCDIGIRNNDKKDFYIPGISGVVEESVLPGYLGLEAGQAAVGDLFNWWAEVAHQGHQEMTAKAELLMPGESGILALDWNNGNRNILQDSQLTGVILGQTLQTRSEEIYRGIIESSAFGSKVILEQLIKYGAQIGEITVCGGISVKSPMAMQIYADVCNRPLKISKSGQTCALGAAIAAAVSAGTMGSFNEALSRLTGTESHDYVPHKENVKTYDRLYQVYLQVHDSFGGVNESANLGKVMKDLISLRNEIKDVQA